MGDVYACPFAIHDAVPGRQRAVASAGFDTVWKHLRPVRRAAQPADRRRVHQVLGLRLLPRRLHGREVLHRHAARRPGPGVREGQRGRAGRGAARRRRRTTRTPGRSATRPCRSRSPAGRPTRPATRTRSRGCPPAPAAEAAGVSESPPRAASLGLGQQRWPRVTPHESLLLVPVGSVEQHGPHLPLATDAMIANAVTRAAAERLDAAGAPVLVAPSLNYGASGEHEGFPGTVSIGHEALFLLLAEFGRSAARWARGVIFVNGHGGNTATLTKVVDLLRYEGRAVAWTSTDLPGSDAHAGDTETSLLRHLAPWAVRVDLMEPGATEPVQPADAAAARGRRAGGLPERRARRPHRELRERGRALFERLVANLAAELTALDVTENGRLSRRPAPGPRQGGDGAGGRRAPRWSPVPRAASARPSYAGCWRAGYVVHALDVLGGGATRWPAATTSTPSSPSTRSGCVPVRPTCATCEAMHAAADDVVARHGSLDVVVAGAAVMAGGAPLWETDPEELAAAVGDRRAGGVEHRPRHRPAPARLRHAPSFVGVASVAGRHGLWRLAAYCVAKHAVVGVVRGLAADLQGHRRHRLLRGPRLHRHRRCCAPPPRCTAWTPPRSPSRKPPPVPRPRRGRPRHRVRGDRRHRRARHRAHRRRGVLAVTAPLPSGFTVRLAPGTHTCADGAMLVGGSGAVLRLRPARADGARRRRHRRRPRPRLLDGGAAAARPRAGRPGAGPRAARRAGRRRDRGGPGAGPAAAARPAARRRCPACPWWWSTTARPTPVRPGPWPRSSAPGWCGTRAAPARPRRATPGCPR